jgi:two-component system chemotaxis sensor kinase CheA
LILRSGERQGALVVDEILGEQEIVIKDFRPPIRRVRHVLAAGLLGTGSLVLVLRPLDILLALAAPPSPQGDTAPAVPRVLRVLVVDDSITTRTMERNLFEAAGYRVRVAADGIDGWHLLQNDEIDVVVSDIDMPHMDGFELTSRIRAHPRLAELPVVLVTALEAREDKERGLRVGANAYVRKSGFDQSTLLDIVRRLT